MRGLSGRRDCCDFIGAQGVTVDAYVVDQAVPEAPGLFRILADVDLTVVGPYAANHVFGNVQDAVNIQTDLPAVISACDMMPLPIVDADFTIDPAPSRVARQRQAHTAEFERVGCGVPLQPPGSVAFADYRLVMLIEGVDLYGGTRHSTATALSEHFSEQEIMDAGTIHKSNKAARRYIQVHKNDSLQIYSKVREMQGGKIIKIKKAK